MLAGPPGVLASQPSGTFGVVSVIHFDPFEPEWLAKNLETADLGDWTARLSGLGSPSAVERGRDTTSVLLLSALAGIASMAWSLSATPSYSISMPGSVALCCRNPR